MAKKYHFQLNKINSNSFLYIGIPFFHPASWQRTVLSGIIALLFFSFSLRFYLYPAWFAYQSTSVLGKEIHAQKWPAERIFVIVCMAIALIFTPNESFRLLLSLRFKKIPISIQTSLVKKIEENWNGNIETKETFSHFPVSKLTFLFVRKDTREQTLETRYLLHLH